MEAPSAPLLQVRGLKLALPAGGDRVHAVDGIDFDLEAGQILCIVGESGSGKSLTASAIMGLLPRGVRAVGGTIELAGTDLLRLGEDEMRSRRGRDIGMIFQEPMTALNPLMRVGEQIDEVLRVHTALGEAERRARVVELMEQVNLPDPAQLRLAYPFRLSGGQRQRVMIAMALALGPSLLIADEPTTALDVTTQKQILALIKAVQSARGMGVLFITHDFGVVAEIADRVAVMQHGRIVEIGAVADVLDRPQHAYTRALIAAVPRLQPRAPVASAGGLPALVARGITKTYRSAGGIFVRRRVVEAVKAVDLVIAQGETLGVVGESGSGKSTLGRLLIRLLAADGGSVQCQGTDLLAAPPHRLRALRRDVQMVFQDPYASLNPRRRVGAIIADGLLAQGRPRAEGLARARELMGLVGLDPAGIDRYPHEFSGGQRQRIGIARALAVEPKLLIADEPVSALDVSVQAQVLELLADVRRRFDLAMLFITHDLRVAAQICDRIAVMRRGEIVETGPTAEIFADPRHPYTRELLDAVPGRGWRGDAV
ncbi:peptide/nickel transport system ATP-binding protein [Stella humosa]|uniref:Peptide/nickel transport system ATP-binding protein n=1 Tax=Stella humosa TaxID=94 RepID=A0A3N1KYJ0_9PROT|nr:ABC transporter ATP-binding protein [Stella humosa]ROP84492.1 peptide/nickel transport system ATP-binding protein [Stella humosa]BBK34012.1 ABC transporter ATP-binding protein [Stella humosa]